MADENIQQGGTGGQPQSGADNNQPAGQQEPTWFQNVPEQYREEARTGWLRQQDYTKKTQEIADRQKAWETEKSELQRTVDQFQNFQKEYEPFRSLLQKNWDRISPILYGQQQAQQPAQSQDGNKQWDFHPAALSILEQPAWDNVGQYYQARYFNPVIEALKNEFNQALARREQYYQNYLGVMTDAYNRKFADPGLDIVAYMKKALDIQSGKENPMELAYASMTSVDKLKAAEEAAYRRGREDFETEIKNKQVPNGALQNEVIPVFRQKPKTRDEVKEAARQTAIKLNLPWNS